MTAQNSVGETPESNDLLAAYAARAGARDEMLNPDGTVKPVWRDFMAHLGRLSPQDLSRRFARGDQYLRDAGVLFRQYDDTVSSEREWPLSHVPVILEEREWAGISAGLIQRADLLEQVVRDFYGPNDLVRSGHLPATLLGQNPAWLRPMVGVTPPGGNFLNFLSFEIGRGPDGKWWVISDIVEAPSTAGFAIENRVALSRVYPNHFAKAHVHRIAGFFQALQQTLFDLKAGAPGQTAMMSPGPMNQNYAEHAYLARYLGLLLVEGEDLIVENGQVMVRTVAGPRPLSLLWNRVPQSMTDPLELTSDSLIGTPGLIDAIRRGSLRTLNALGAGVLETRALMAFLPRIARERLKTELMLPNIATWWCGHEAEQSYVIANCERMMIGSAFSTVPLLADPATMVFDQPGTDARRDKITALLRESGRELVGQESVTLSNTPVHEDGALVPRPLCLRLFLVRTRKGWEVMPGGYARVSAGDDPKAFAMQRGGRVADVWIVSDSAVPRTSLLTVEETMAGDRPAEIALPSRAADNLFWLGRNVERAELNMRLFRAYFARLGDGAEPGAPLMKMLRGTLMIGVKGDTPAAMAASFADPLEMALQSATKIGDRFSPDGMKSLKELVRSCRAFRARLDEGGESPTEVSLLLRQITGFSGLVHENMYRSNGWRFLSLGFSVERAGAMTRLLRHLTTGKAPDGSLDLLLELGDSIVAHRARFSILAHAHSVLDLLSLDMRNPRAVRYHLSRAREHVGELPSNRRDHVLGPSARAILRLDTDLATATPADLTAERLEAMERAIWAFADTLTEEFLV
ncbi:MAG: circularly permuted type 2 ATP-grasp protein [Pseudooceanicola sp.]